MRIRIVLVVLVIAGMIVVVGSVARFQPLGYKSSSDDTASLSSVDKTKHEQLTEAKLCGHGSVSPEERTLLHRMQEMRLPSISFRPPTTLKDAVEFGENGCFIPDEV